MIKSKIFDRLDLSDDFWDQFGVQNKKLKKQVVLYKIDNINKPNIITIALNPKEYYEKINNHTDNKKRKGLKKSTRGMDFDSYSERLADLSEFSKEYLKKKQKKLNRKDFKLLTNLCKWNLLVKCNLVD